MNYPHLKSQLVLIFSLLCISSVAKATNVPTTGTLLEVEAELKLHNNTLKLHNTVSSTTDQTVNFYITSDLNLSSLMITNHMGKDLKYDVNKSASSYFVTVQSQGDSKIQVDYDIRLSKIKHSISHWTDKNQCFLLPEVNLFPRNSNKFSRNSTLYKVKVGDESNPYDSHYSSNDSYSTVLPSIILGNFNIVDCDHVLAYIPKDIVFDQKRLQYIVSQFKNSYKFYTNVFGSAKITNHKIFFLNRRGGYAIPNGMVLSQKYITDQYRFNKASIARVVSHETAHLWWGITSSPKSHYMNESLAEFSSDVYLSSHNIIDTRSIYSDKNMHMLNANISPRDIASIELTDMFYRPFAYQKVPIILHELEMKLGLDTLLDCMKSYYTASKRELNNSQPVDLLKFIPTNVQQEFHNDLDGSLADWPDFYIHEVTNDKVIFRAHSVKFKESVPTEVTLENNTVVHDTLHFDSATTEVVKQYNHKIKQVVLDSKFATNQSCLLNDLWIKSKPSPIHNKWYIPYNKKYQTFFDTLITYLFTTDHPSIQEFVDKRNLAVLKKAKVKLENIDLTGTFVFVRGKKNYFKIMIGFPYKGQFKQGYVDGFYYEENGHIKLKSIKRFKI